MHHHQDNAMPALPPICLSSLQCPTLILVTLALHTAPTVTLGSALVPRSASSLPSRTDAAAIAQFSMELHKLDTVHAYSHLVSFLRPS